MNPRVSFIVDPVLHLVGGHFAITLSSKAKNSIRHVAMMTNISKELKSAMFPGFKMTLLWQKTSFGITT